MSRLLKLLFLKGITPKIMEISKYLGRKFGVHVLKNTWCINLCPQCNICWVKTFFFFICSILRLSSSVPLLLATMTRSTVEALIETISTSLEWQLCYQLSSWEPSTSGCRASEKSLSLSLSLPLPPSPSLSLTLLSCDSLFAILILLLAIHWTQ